MPGLEQVKEFAHKQGPVLLGLLVVAVVIIVALLAGGCAKIATKAEGVTAGGAQDQDTVTVGGASREGFHWSPMRHEGYMRRREGASNGPAAAVTPVRAALAVENSAALRKELGCKPVSRGSDLVKGSNGWGVEGMTVDQTLRDAMLGK